jgi:hypothetical protein
MTNYFEFAKSEAGIQSVYRHKPQIFGHGNARWNFKKIFTLTKNIVPTSGSEPLGLRLVGATPLRRVKLKSRPSPYNPTGSSMGVDS